MDTYSVQCHHRLYQFCYELVCYSTDFQVVTFLNWRGLWNKALSDFWCNVKFSSSFTIEYKEIWKENLVIYQKSLKAFLQAPLQFMW